MASERADLVTEILRNEWGFDGMVMSDWYGGQYAFGQMLAGNDLLMPGKRQQRDEIKAAVLNGHLPMDIIDRNVKHILECVVKTPRFKGYVADNNPDLAAHAGVAQSASDEGMVLLKNSKNTLPFNGKDKKIAVFGCTSYDFIAGGTGSGDVHHAYVVNLIDGLKKAGFDIDNEVSDKYTAYIPVEKEKLPRPTGKLASFMPRQLVPEMPLDGIDVKKAAKTNDIAIITIGKTSGEFYDRRLSDNYNLTPMEQELISTVCRDFHKAGKRVVVILNNCGVIETSSWIDKPDAVLLAWLPGQEGGNSVADILVGNVNPSGRLPMTWAIRYEDDPTFEDFPLVDSLTQEEIERPIIGHASGRYEGDKKNYDITTYNEGIEVGYRYFNTKDVPVAFPFGYGLSYTEFGYDNLKVDKDDDGNITISVKVTNKGKRAGKEVVQVYVTAPGKDMPKPRRELKAFAKTTELGKGESETVSITIPYTELASFNEDGSCWQVEEGDYIVSIARNVNDSKPLTATVHQNGAVTEKTAQCLLPIQK